MVESFLSEIRGFFSENANPDLVKKYSRYFKDGYDAWGVAQDIFISQKDKWFEEKGKSLGLPGFLALGDELMKSGKYEEGSLAVMFLLKYKRDFSREVLARVGTWLENYVTNWAHTDYICSEIIGYCYKKGIAGYEDVADWKQSESIWQRRAVPVSMIACVKMNAEVGPLLLFVESLMMDAARPVQQGEGWFLREAWKRHPAEVEVFLKKWKNESPRLIFQYATEKMEKDKKEEFRREKKK